MMPTTLLSILAGIAVAVAIVVAAHRFRWHFDRIFYPAILVIVAIWYPLFAVLEGRGITEELTIAVLFGAIALGGYLRWWWMISVGLILHGVFDLVHQDLWDDHGVPLWWPSFCVTVDVALGAAAMWQPMSRNVSPPEP